MRDLVELFVTKKIFFPSFLSNSRTEGTLSMSESPFQMTPSQSKMKTSVLSRRSDGTVSLVQRPFACELDEIERVCEL